MEFKFTNTYNLKYVYKNKNWTFSFHWTKSSDTKHFNLISMVLWKLVFYLTSNQREIHSEFVSSITHQLFQSEEIKGISGQLYHLYKGQMSSTWLSYNSHFSLTFGSEVSRLDWLKVKQTLSSQWCRNRIGKYCNRFSFISMGHWLYPNGKK